jgi:hypothetical protein
MEGGAKSSPTLARAAAGAILKLLQAIYQPPEASFRAAAMLDLLRNGTVALHYD